MTDLVYVAYNSAKWIEQCFTSLTKTQYDKKKLHVYVVDNASTDNTVELLRQMKEKIGGEFAAFEIIEETKNWGFGIANNIGFKKGSSDIVCFLNIDTEVFSNTFTELDKEVAASDEKVAVWEFRQFPYEHPKMYHPLTGETTWVSGAAFAVRRKVYEELGGFDERIFMYAEDVDLSWRIRACGYKLKYSPRVKITHYSYASAGEVKPNQHIFSVINNLMLRARFCGIIGNLRGHLHFWNLILRNPPAFPGAKRKLLKQYFVHLKDIPHFKAHNKYKTRPRVGTFIGWDYSTNRDGAFYEAELPAENPLVSIIVRTCGRPSYLRETLISLRNQTYDNLEVVVVEDGEAVADKMIREEFSDMNIIYQATGEKAGRSKAGNLAMTLAHGKYLNFLDDDDLFYADHVEVLVTQILKSGDRAAYATSFETPIIIKSRDPYIYELTDHQTIHKQEFDRIMLCHHNYIPIQCIMFEKTLFEEFGGLDESTEALEDWDMWLRYAMHTDFTFVFKTTSEYRVPAVKEINEKRQKDLDDALIVMRKKHRKYMAPMNASDMAKIYEKLFM